MRFFSFITVLTILEDLRTEGHMVRGKLFMDNPKAFRPQFYRLEKTYQFPLYETEREKGEWRKYTSWQAKEIKRLIRAHYHLFEPTLANRIRGMLQSIPFSKPNWA